MSGLTYLLERNLRIRRLVREALPQPSVIDVDEILSEIEELLDMLKGYAGSGFAREGMDDLPNIVKIKAALALLTEELKFYLIRRAVSP